MTGTQPQLLNIALNPTDVVYTPDWVAEDMVTYFNPWGHILEPCIGDGVFLKYLSGCVSWCEIEKGRDFFQWTEPVDWAIGNPPYAVAMNWIYHTMTITDNFVYLIPCNKPFNSAAALFRMKEWGEPRHMRVYSGGAALGFPIGFAIGAIHFQRNYHGGMTMSYYDDTPIYDESGNGMTKYQNI